MNQFPHIFTSSFIYTFQFPTQRGVNQILVVCCSF